MISEFDYRAEVNFYGLVKVVEATSFKHLARELNISHVTLRKIYYEGKGTSMFQNIKITRTPNKYFNPNRTRPNRDESSTNDTSKGS